MPKGRKHLLVCSAGVGERGDRGSAQRPGAAPCVCRVSIKRGWCAQMMNVAVRIDPGPAPATGACPPSSALIRARAGRGADRSWIGSVRMVDVSIGSA